MWPSWSCRWPCSPRSPRRAWPRASSWSPSCGWWLSGNFSWLNWATILLALSAVDGRLAAGVLPLPTPPPLAAPPVWYEVLVAAVFVLVVVLSYWPARNLLSGRQLMNYSFNPLHLVNTYGAFGSVNRSRQEVVIEGTAAAVLTPDTVWKEYEFRGKPGDVRRMPRQFAPYHLRLDWMMWFAGISSAYAGSWFTPLVGKLLVNDRATLKLLRASPFPDRRPRTSGPGCTSTGSPPGGSGGPVAGGGIAP